MFALMVIAAVCGVIAALDISPRPLAVSENSSPGTMVGCIEVNGQLEGLDGYTCTVQDERFEIRLFTMDLKQCILTKVSLDRELQSTCVVTVSCTSATGQTASQVISVTVSDVNDNIPRFEGRRPLEISLRPGEHGVGRFREIGEIHATDADSGENGRVTFSLEGEGADMFWLGAKNGILRTKVVIDQTMVGDQIVLQVRATDHGDAAGGVARSAVAPLVINII